jgi:Putative quorum-sensing-regulated virulence factor
VTRMPFGRYRGCLVTDLPDSYLEWLYRLDDLREPLHSAVDREWRARFEPADVQASESLPSDVRPLVEEIVTVGYRAYVQRHHPDHGGETRTMQGVNAAATWLRRLIRGASSE